MSWSAVDELLPRDERLRLGCRPSFASMKGSVSLFLHKSTVRLCTYLLRSAITCARASSRCTAADQRPGARSGAVDRTHLLQGLRSWCALEACWTESAAMRCAQHLVCRETRLESVLSTEAVTVVCLARQSHTKEATYTGSCHASHLGCSSDLRHHDFSFDACAWAGIVWPGFALGGTVFVAV